MVYYDLQQCLIEWKRERLETIDEYVTQELRKLDKMEQQAWEAWEVSKTGKQRIVLTSVVSLLFTAACLYSVVSSVSRLGERKGDMKTGHIRPVMLRPETTTIYSNIQKHENGLSENQGTAGAVK